MDLNELRKLSPGDAMQAAAKELALPSDFFDKMWNQESGRGTNMRSAAGALGHFQTMPATQHAWEQRDGASYNPDDFYDGLYMAARTMGENLAKFKDPIDATRAYNAGWNPKRWGNPETVGYVHALWGNSAPAQPGAPPTDVSAEDWPRLPSLPKGRPAPLHDEAMAKEVDIGTEVGRQDAAARTVSLTHDDEVAREADAAQVTARKDATGITEVAYEAERDPRVMPTWSVMNKITAEPADPNYDYMAHREELEAGMNDDEREYMRENVNSDASARRARAEIEYRRGLDQTYSDAGGLKTFVGQMAAGTTDPASLLMGLGTVKAFQMARVGGNALVRASLENAAVNVGVTGLSDAVGETKTTADYAMAGAQGALLGAVLSRGKVKSANEADISNIARSIHERGTQEQVAAVSKVMGDEPHLAPEQVARRVEQNEAENIGRAVDESTNGPARLDQVVPEDVRQSMEAEFTGQPEEPAKPVPDAQAAPTDEAASAAPQAAKEPFDHALVPEEQPNIIEQLRKGDVTREVKDTSGAGIKLSWRPEPNKLKPHGNLGETLEAIQSHPTATSMDKRLAQYLSRVMSDDGLAMDIRFNLRDARSNMNSDGGVNINGTTSGIQRNPVDLTSQVHGLTRYGVYSVIHEVVHAATWHRINAWETAAGKLRPEQRNVLSQFQDLFDRYKETVQNGLPTATEDHGAKYAAKNLHEFAAQILSDTETRLVLSVMPGKPVAGKVSTALREVMSLFRKVLGLEGRNGFTEAASLVDQIIALPVDNIAFKDGTPVFAAQERPVTDTPQFKTWFGKSKAVEVGGKPRVMYHGTSVSPEGEGFHSFDTYNGNHGLFGMGGYFTDKTSVANTYTAKGTKHPYTGQDDPRFAGNPTVYPVYLKIENPMNMDGPAKAAAWAKAFPDVDFEGDYKPAENTNEAFYRQVENHAHDEQMLRSEAVEHIQEGIRSMGHDGLTHIGGGRVLPDGEAHRVFIAFDPEQIKSAIGNTAFDGTKPGIAEAAPDTGSVPGANPIAARRARDTWAEKINQHASDFIRAHPIDTSRLNVVTAKIGGISDGLALASSKSNIMKMVASLVTETTTGAAGRGPNVAVRTTMLHSKFVGNGMLDYDNAYSVFRGRNGGGVIEDAWSGNVRRKFDQKVTEEILSRKLGEYKPNADATVVEAADALEGLFDRARQGQIDAGVLGHANLPATSKGYLPQALDGIKLQAATVEDMGLLHKALSKQFQERLGFDEKFANDFAPFYTERARERSMGSKNIEGLGAGGDGLQLVRDVLDDAAQGGSFDSSIVDRARAAISKSGQGHTKKRLDVDLLAELRPGLRMMDFYVTNPLVLARSYAKRTAGVAALTEAGVHGIRGVRELRAAALSKGAEQPTLQELNAFDRVTAEILGTPVAGKVVSSGATNLGLLVGLQRLGGLVFQQVSETWQMLHHTGLRSMLDGVPTLKDKLGEVGRLRRGMPSGNHILTSMETYGGEIGMESYKMIAPLDAPDATLSQYMDQPGLVSRLLRAGGHLQSKISGFRGFLAAQHRMVAEQIVMRAARMIRDGQSDIALRDMGFTPEVAASLKSDLAHVAKWDDNDKLMEFDLTRVSDARTAEAFVQAVHRGTSQIIQGTFVGERNAWFHNDYLRLLLQLRTFGLTASEKQWGRTRMNHGYAYASGVMLGQMALALPIYMAKLQVMTLGMSEDAKQKFLKQNMTPGALVKATMNYSSVSGNTGDVLELMTGIAGGWAKSQQTKDLLGVGSQATSVRSISPAVSSADAALRVVGGHADVHTALKQLPFSNLWYLAPGLNLTKDK